MKKFILLTFFAAFAITINAQNDSAQLSKAVLEAIKTNDFKALQNLVAAPNVYRKIFGKETEGKTDKEILDLTANSAKLKSDFEAIQKSAGEKKIKMAGIKFESVTIENPWGSETGPFAMEIKVSYNGKTDSIAVSSLKDGNNWYLSEILISGNVFRKLAE